MSFSHDLFAVGILRAAELAPNFRDGRIQFVITSRIPFEQLIGVQQIFRNATSGDGGDQLFFRTSRFALSGSMAASCTERGKSGQRASRLVVVAVLSASKPRRTAISKPFDLSSAGFRPIGRAFDELFDVALGWFGANDYHQLRRSSSRLAAASSTGSGC